MAGQGGGGGRVKSHLNSLLVLRAGEHSALCPLHLPDQLLLTLGEKKRSESSEDEPGRGQGMEMGRVQRRQSLSTALHGGALRDRVPSPAEDTIGESVA